MNGTRRIAIGSDHRGPAMVETLSARLVELGWEVLPVGACTSDSCDYPENAWAVASAVAAGDAELGVIVCGSGIGVSMAANKVDGVRAALAHDAHAAEMSRRHNDANVLCLSADRDGCEPPLAILEAFLGAAFEGGRHARRVAKITAIEAGLNPATVATD